MAHRIKDLRFKERVVIMESLVKLCTLPLLQNFKRVCSIRMIEVLGNISRNVEVVNEVIYVLLLQSFIRLDVVIRNLNPRIRTH